MVDFRNLGPPQQAAAQSLPPSLLQMAQGQAPEGWQSNPELNNGAPYRAITSPEDQNWSDLQGNPIHMGGPAPAYNPGTTFGGYNAVFDERAPSSTGGWFTMNDYLNQAPTPMEAATGPAGTMQSPQRQPRVGHVNENALSTNNWRLLPPNFQTPDYFQINGNIVSRSTARRELSPRSVLGQEGGGVHPGYIHQGGGQWGMPVGSHGLLQGYIGGDGWGMSATPTY